ncbi:unnamed protein product [Adineta steineri]|uniref:Sulfatase N-terminal domain-containing protein n=1 Tax=Adineta steineri TaxID=433720 RepID=A0A820A928_9BILA|nr:unnamed protein product [Adineta steineri]
MMSLLITGTHEPFLYPEDRSYNDYQYYTNDPRINAHLNTLRITDELFGKLIHGFKSRKLYDETLFIVVSDHGYVFNDYGSQTLGLLSSPLESAFSVPLIFHNRYLQAKQLHGQYSTMDILPTIMDILLSSSKKNKKLTDQLLSSVENQQLKTILYLYEGTSILRRRVEEESIRYIFNLANPGNSFLSIKQYPRKLTYDITNDEVHLYHLQYDPFESIDLINLSNQPIDNYPSWIHINHHKQILKYRWKGRWISKTIRINMFSQILSEKKKNNHWLRPKSVILNNSKIDLDEMLNWADRTFELTRLWTKLIFKRYRTNNTT